MARSTTSRVRTVAVGAERGCAAPSPVVPLGSAGADAGPRARRRRRRRASGRTMFVVASGVRARSVPTARAERDGRARATTSRPHRRPGGLVRAARAAGGPIERRLRRGRSSPRTRRDSGGCARRGPAGGAARRGSRDERGRDRSGRPGERRRRAAARRRAGGGAAAAERAGAAVDATQAGSRDPRCHPVNFGFRRLRVCTMKCVSLTISSVLAIERGSSKASAAGDDAGQPADPRGVARLDGVDRERRHEVGAVLDQRRLAPCRPRPRGPRTRPRSCGSARRPRSRRGSRSAGA